MGQCCTDQKNIPKKKYRTKEEAEKVAEQRNDEGIAVRVYPCEDGDGWHLTSRNAPIPERPKNVMTTMERQRYAKRNKNRLGDLVSEELVNQLKDDARKNTLPILEKKINQLQRECDEKIKVVLSRREDLAILQKSLKSSERELRSAKQNLLAAKRNYERAKIRINKES